MTASRSMRRVAVTIATAAVLLPLASPQAAGETESVGTVREAWYQAPLIEGADPLCQAPAACSPTSPTGYPEDTLHVGNLGGNTTDLTALTFDLSVVPLTADLTGGIADLPVADSSSGTSSPETAAFVACLVTESFQEAHGAAASEAPSYDCGTSSPATYLADPAPGRFTVDLAPFLASWRSGGGQGIALVPAEDDTGTWHVAFSGRDREAEGAAPPITARFEFTSASAADEDGASGGLFGPGSSTADGTGTGSGSASGSGTYSPPTFSSGEAFAPSATTPQPDVAPPPVDEPVAAEPAPQPVAAAPTPAGVTYAYPWGWLMPLVLVFAAGGLARALVRPVEVLPDDAPRGLAGRLWLAVRPEHA